MIALDSPRWGQLQSAYGAASDIPELLRKLDAYPPCLDYESEPYFSLWSSLCHQGDVYSASYAAVPHLARVFQGRPSPDQTSTLQLLVCIEIARARGNGPELPSDLRDGYFEALGQAASSAIENLGTSPSEEFTRAALAAVAVAVGHGLLADALLELEPEVLEDFSDWRLER